MSDHTSLDLRSLVPDVGIITDRDGTSHDLLSSRHFSPADAARWMALAKRVDALRQDLGNLEPEQYDEAIQLGESLIGELRHLVGLIVPSLSPERLGTMVYAELSAIVTLFQRREAEINAALPPVNPKVGGRIPRGKRSPASAPPTGSPLVK
jgi:DNA-binding XRE family transcriptional regulator